VNTRVMIFAGALLVIIPFYVYFERQKPSARRIVLLTVLTALAVAGRAAFFMVPFFKPVLAFAIIAGISMGPNAGFIVGSMTALVSNFLYGQGPWTVFQMAAWGLTGLIAGLIFTHPEKVKTPAMMVYGFVSAFLLHGAITDIWTIFFVNEHPTLATVIATYSAAIVPDAVLGAATAFFLLILGKPIIRKIDRVRVKYGLEVRV
jgi:uncharacterized membrane protein